MGHFDLNAAVVLVRVVQAGSFRGAARALGLPKTTVSRKVTELEEQLGARLLHRTTRSLALTDAGAAFVEETEAALAHLEAAEQAVSSLQRAPRGRVRVTTTVAFGQMFMAPMVAEFLRAHPAVEVALHVDNRPIDLIRERYDVALRTGHLPDSGLVARQVGAGSYRVVASPAYLRAHGTPRRPEDLTAHACLLGAVGSGAARATWAFGAGRRARQIPVAGRFVADDLIVVREAALAGLGLARLPWVIVHDAVRARRLVAVLEDHAPPPTPLHIVHVGGRHLPPRVRAFVDFALAWLTQRLAEFEAG